MRFSAALLLASVAYALPVEKDVVVTQEQTVTTTYCPETAEGETASPIVKAVTAYITTTVQSTDVVTAPCSKCEEEEKAKETAQGVPSSVPAAVPVPETPAPAPAPAPVATSAPAPVPEAPAAVTPAPAPAPAAAEPSTVWEVVTQYTTICPQDYVPPPCDEQAAALSSVVSAASASAANGSSAAAAAAVPDVPASVSIPDSLTAALASAIAAAATYSVDPSDTDVTYLDVTVTPTSTVNKTVTPTVTVSSASSFATGPGKTEATPAVSTDAAAPKIVGNAPPTPGPTVSTASDFSASVASAASAAVGNALKELAF